MTAPSLIVQTHTQYVCWHMHEWSCFVHEMFVFMQKSLFVVHILFQGDFKKTKQNLYSATFSLLAVFFWSHAEQGPSVHHRKCGGEWPRLDARLPQGRAHWPRLSPTPWPCSGLLRNALKTKNTCRALAKAPHIRTHAATFPIIHRNMHKIANTQMQILT